MNNKFHSYTKKYLSKLESCFDEELINGMAKLTNDLRKAWKEKKSIFICGNGGSGSNANHIANDLLYGVGFNRETGKYSLGMRVESLVSNSGVITCLANDINYEDIFSKQIEIKGNEEDLLITLSGSGNSANIIKALNKANSLGLNTTAIVGFDGGECKKIARNVIHTSINDMEISEDIQMIIFNICKQWLIKN